MSQIGQHKISEKDLKNTLSYTEQIIKNVSFFGGKIFGEYIREVIVPRMKTPNCDIQFNYLNIWFRKEIEASNFLKYMKIEHLVYENREACLSGDCFIDELNRDYIIINNNYLSVPINIIITVNELFPISNFDTNNLMYFYINNNPILESSSHFKKDNLIESIHKKEATLIKYYFINSINDKTSYSKVIDNINKLYLIRKWKIIFEDLNISHFFKNTKDNQNPEKIKNYLNSEKLTTVANDDKDDKDDKDIKQLINNCIECDKQYRNSIIKRNEAIFEYVTKMGITDKNYIVNNIVGYPEKLDTKFNQTQ